MSHPFAEEYERRGAGHGTAHGTSPPASRRVTGIAAPVIDPALSDARKAATLAILAGVTQALLSAPGVAARFCGVSITPGRMRLQTMPFEPCSSATASAMRRTADLARAINADAGRCAQTGGGGYMDDATIMTFGRDRYDCGARRERDPRVDREQNLPIVQSRLSDPARPESADRIHERIDTGPNRSTAAPHGRAGVGGLGEIKTADLQSARAAPADNEAASAQNDGGSAVLQFRYDCGSEIAAGR